jgi:hypothetical protein
LRKAGRRGEDSGRGGKGETRRNNIPRRVNALDLIALSDKAIGEIPSDETR